MRGGRRLPAPERRHPARRAGRRRHRLGRPRLPGTPPPRRRGAAGRRAPARRGPGRRRTGGRSGPQGAGRPARAHGRGRPRLAARPRGVVDAVRGWRGRRYGRPRQRPRRSGGRAGPVPAAGRYGTLRHGDPGSPEPSTPSAAPSRPAPPTRTADPAPEPDPEPQGTSSGTAATPPASCSVDYDVVNEWPDGYQATVTVTPGHTLNGWHVAFTLPAGHRITQMWDASSHQTGSRVTATAADYNATVAQDSTVAFGFIAARRTDDTHATDFALDGRPARWRDPHSDSGQPPHQQLHPRLRVPAGNRPARVSIASPCSDAQKTSVSKAAGTPSPPPPPTSPPARRTRPSAPEASPPPRTPAPVQPEHRVVHGGIALGEVQIRPGQRPHPFRRTTPEAPAPASLNSAASSSAP